MPRRTPFPQRALCCHSTNRSCLCFASREVLGYHLIPGIWEAKELHLMRAESNMLFEIGDLHFLLGARVSKVLLAFESQKNSLLYGTITPGTVNRDSGILLEFPYLWLTAVLVKAVPELKPRDIKGRRWWRRRRGKRDGEERRRKKRKGGRKEGGRRQKGEKQIRELNTRSSLRTFLLLSNLSEFSNSYIKYLFQDFFL